MSLDDIINLKISFAPAERDPFDDYVDDPRAEAPTQVELKALWHLAREVQVTLPVFGTVALDWVMRCDRPGAPEILIVVTADVAERGDAERARYRFRENFPHYAHDHASRRVYREMERGVRHLPVKLTKPVNVMHALDRLRCGCAQARTFLSHKAREALHEFVMHEVDEMLLVDGERVFDPHAPRAIHQQHIEGRFTK